MKSIGRFGLELTVTSSEMIKLASTRKSDNYYEDDKEYSELYLKLLTEWTNEISKVNGLTVIPTDNDKYGFQQITIELPSKQQLLIHYDDWVFEIGSSPYTSHLFSQDLDLIQQIIYDKANKLGLSPHSRIGCGHIHMEYSSHFDNNALLLRNFVIDLFNRPYLFLGAISLDLLNSPPISILSEDQQKCFINILNEFDSLKQEEQTIKIFCELMNEKVYTSSYVKGESTELTHFRVNQNKFQAINFQHDQTLEIRGLRPQKNAKEVLYLMNLFEGRVNKLKSEKGPIAYIPINLKHKCSYTSMNNIEKYEVDIDAKEIYEAFVNYTKDSGVDFKDELITDELRLRMNSN